MTEFCLLKKYFPWTIDYLHATVIASWSQIKICVLAGRLAIWIIHSTTRVHGSQNLGNLRTFGSSHLLGNVYNRVHCNFRIFLHKSTVDEIEALTYQASKSWHDKNLLQIVGNDPQLKELLTVKHNFSLSVS